MIQKQNAPPCGPLWVRSVGPVLCSILLTACGGSGGDTGETSGNGGAAPPAVVGDGAAVPVTDDVVTSVGDGSSVPVTEDVVTSVEDDSPEPVTEAEVTTPEDGSVAAGVDTASTDGATDDGGNPLPPEPAVVAVPGPLPGGAVYPAPDDCSATAQKDFVNAAMHDYYYLYDQVPEVDLSAYATPEDLLEALIVNPPDRFSFLFDKGEAQRLYEGIEYNFGFLPAIAPDGRWRIAQMFFESPAYLAGIRRGDQLLAINDIAPQAWQIADLDELFFNASPENPQTARFTVVDKAGEQRTVSLTTAAYPSLSAPLSRVLESGSGTRVGYLQFDKFTDNAVANVAYAISFFKESEISELVVDLRYNPGGQILQALQNMTQLAGERLTGQVAASFRFNDRYAAALNEEALFLPAPDSLELPRLVFLVSRLTASAAEMLINSLQPYTEVVVIGNGRTYGKAYAFRGIEHCDNVLFAIDSENVNIAGESVAGGLVPDCWAGDDLLGERGSLADTMFVGALNYLSNGTCLNPPGGEYSGPVRNADKGATPLLRPPSLGLW